MIEIGSQKGESDIRCCEDVLRVRGSKKLSGLLMKTPFADIKKAEKYLLVLLNIHEFI